MAIARIQVITPCAVVTAMIEALLFILFGLLLLLLAVVLMRGKKKKKSHTKLLREDPIEWKESLYSPREFRRKK